MLERPTNTATALATLLLMQQLMQQMGGPQGLLLVLATLLLMQQMGGRYLSRMATHAQPVHNTMPRLFAAWW